MKKTLKTIASVILASFITFTYANNQISLSVNPSTNLFSVITLKHHDKLILRNPLFFPVSLICDVNSSTKPLIDLMINSNDGRDKLTTQSVGFATIPVLKSHFQLAASDKINLYLIGHGVVNIVSDNKGSLTFYCKMQ